jgi:hypothetical protein
MMIDERTLLIHKLKDTAVDYLTEKMREDIGKISDQYQKEINDKIIEWVKASHPYFSTTEFRKAFKELCQTNQMIYFSFILSNANDKVDAIDEWYDLGDNKLMPNRYYMSHSAGSGKAYTIIPKHSGPNSGVSTNLHQSYNLKDLLKRLKVGKDKRKVKRLSRRKKVKGGKVFDL